MNLTRKALIWISENQTLRQKLPRYRFVQRAVSRFMPGEELTDALAAGEGMKGKNITSLLTLLGENITEPKEAEKVARHYIDALPEIKQKGLDGQISIKLTQLGLDLGEELCYQNLAAIVNRAREFDNWVWIDMEQSKYVDRTLVLYKKARREYTKVGVCLQSYLYRTAKDLEELLPLSPGIRLVKGAYAEPVNLAYPKKKDVDANFMTLAKALLANIKKQGITFGVGTHDLGLIRKVQQEAEALGLSKSDYEFELLYGVQSEEQLRLAQAGHRVRCLISYGHFWFPWYVRRLAERPANIFFAVKQLFRN
ncbi:MAG TPA: proline dehydrogenase family protein [candidate division Zixibacteria bacterium]|nr:proline dehydrogenase family protein [candidate division Zixibacteria bacterium]